MHRYPVTETIEAFGGQTAMHRATGISISTIHNWTKNHTGYIPAWRSAAIEAGAKKARKKLPAPVSDEAVAA